MKYMDMLDVLDDVKVVLNEGMPHHRNPFDKGRLIINFKVQQMYMYTVHVHVHCTCTCTVCSEMYITIYIYMYMYMDVNLCMYCTCTICICYHNVQWNPSCLSRTGQD